MSKIKTFYHEVGSDLFNRENFVNPDRIKAKRRLKKEDVLNEFVEQRDKVINEFILGKKIISINTSPCNVPVDYFESNNSAIFITTVLYEED